MGLEEDAMQLSFVRTKHDYDAYTDFWKLVNLSGFQTTTTAQADLRQRGLYICPNLDHDLLGWATAAPKGRRGAKVVFWDLERPDAHLREGMDPVSLYRAATDEILEWADAIWVSDMGLRKLDLRRTFAVLGGHEGLMERRPATILHDILHLGQRTPRRISVLDALRLKSFRIVEPTWGTSRLEALASSRVLLGIDRIGHLKVGAPLRWVVAAAYGLPIITEAVADPYPLTPGQDIVMAPYDRLADTVIETLSLEPSALAWIGQLAWATYCRVWTFRYGVEDAIARGPVDFQ